MQVDKVEYIFSCVFFCVAFLFSGDAAVFVFFFQAEDGIRDLVRSRGLGDVYKRQAYPFTGRIDGVDYRPGPAPADSPNSLIEVLRQMGSKFE